jgi:hypothetical protein
MLTKYEEITFLRMLVYKKKNILFVFFHLKNNENFIKKNSGEF